MKSKKNCEYYTTCGSPENCHRCKGYRKAKKVGIFEIVGWGGGEELMKGYPVECEEQFKLIFGVPLERFGIKLIKGLWMFDIMWFDDYYKKKYGEYEDGKTSLKDAVQKRFGDAGVDILLEAMEEI